MAAVRACRGGAPRRNVAAAVQSVVSITLLEQVLATRVPFVWKPDSSTVRSAPGKPTSTCRCSLPAWVITAKAAPQRRLSVSHFTVYCQLRASVGMLCAVHSRGREHGGGDSDGARLVCDYAVWQVSAQELLSWGERNSGADDMRSANLRSWQPRCQRFGTSSALAFTTSSDGWRRTH